MCDRARQFYEECRAAVSMTVSGRYRLDVALEIRTWYCTMIEYRALQPSILGIRDCIPPFVNFEHAPIVTTSVSSHETSRLACFINNPINVTCRPV